MPDGGAGETALIAAMLGSSAISGALAPSPQIRQSFAGSGSTDPHNVLAGVLGQNSALQSRITGEHFSLPDAYVQGGPAFAGGGLPMPIGLTGRDPLDAASAPGALTTRRVTGQDNHIFTPDNPETPQRFTTPIPTDTGSPNNVIDPVGGGNPQVGAPNGGAGGVHRVSMGAQRMPASADDFTQALSALKLLHGGGQ